MQTSLFNSNERHCSTATPTIISPEITRKITTTTTTTMNNHHITPSKATRRCLFGPPDPQSIENLLTQVTTVDRIRAMRNYGYDTHKDQHIDRNDVNAYENALNVLKENCASGLIDENRIDRIQTNFGHYFNGFTDMQKIDLIINRDNLLLDTLGGDATDGYQLGSGLDKDDREDVVELNQNIQFQLEHSFNSCSNSNVNNCRSIILQKCENYRNTTKPSTLRRERREAKSSPYKRNTDNKFTGKYQQESDNLQSPPAKKSKDDHHHHNE